MSKEPDRSDRPMPLTPEQLKERGKRTQGNRSMHEMILQNVTMLEGASEQKDKELVLLERIAVALETIAGSK